MFGKLQGLVEYIGDNFIILMAGGVGFKVMLPANILSSVKAGKESSFWIETVVREDAITLIGFNNMDEQVMFQKLVTVSGIGTKVALAILGAFKVNVLQTAIFSGDVKTLTSVPGVGKKVAERIIVELKGKASAVISEEGETADIYNDVLGALESLGYRRNDCVEMVQKIVKDNPDNSVQTIITICLREIADNR